MIKKFLLQKYVVIPLVVLALVTLVLLLMSFSMSSIVSILHGKEPLDRPREELNARYDDIAKEWLGSIEWMHPDTGEIVVGLTDELRDQVTELDAHLSSGLLKALSVFRGRFSEEEASWFADMLEPKKITVKQYTVNEKTYMIQKYPDGTTSEKLTSDFSYNVLRIMSLKDYQGLHTYEYKMLTRSYVVQEMEDNSVGIMKIVEEPILIEDSLDEDYEPLYKVMAVAKLRGKKDMEILFRQSLAFDPYFNDPKAFSILPDYKGKAIGFTGEYINGEYSLDTIVTEYSGVTVNQIQEILKGTPMEGSAHTFMRAGRQYGIDPAFLVGIAGAEQGFRPFHNNAFGITGRGDAGSACAKHACFAAYSSVDVGIYAAARLLSGPLYVQSGRVTIRDIWQRWAPGEAKNDPNGLNANWAKNVINMMAKVKSL